MTAALPPLDEVLDLLPDAVCVVGPDDRLLYVNAGFERIFGYAPGEVVGRSIFDLVHPDDHDDTAGQAARVRAGALQRHYRNRYVHKDGHTVDVQWSARRIPGSDVRIGVGREVTELRRAERELEYRATHDSLTGLVNRDRLRLELQGAIEHAKAAGCGLALLYIDLDGFKRVNDDVGHAVGDRLLRELAERMRRGVRQSDLVARVGGDEFVVLLPGCGEADDAQRLADSLRGHLAAPCPLPEGIFRVDASIGVATFPEHGADAGALLGYADRAMYAAKRARRVRLSGVAAKARPA